MLLSLWNVEPVLTLVGVADQSVLSPHTRANKVSITSVEERPPPGR